MGGKKTGTIRDVCKLCEIPVSVFINRILWKPSPTVALPIVCGHFCATGEELSGYDKRLTTWLAEPKIFTNWSFTERSQPLFRGSGRDWRSICQRPCWDNISIGTKTQRCRRVLAGCQESRASWSAGWAQARTPGPGCIHVSQEHTGPAFFPLESCPLLYWGVTDFKPVLYWRDFVCLVVCFF